MGYFLDILDNCKLNFLYKIFFCNEEKFIGRDFDQNSKGYFFFFWYKLGFERSKVVISFNNSGNSSLSSPINTNFRSNHVNGYVYCFHSLILLLPLLFFVVFFHNIGCGHMNIVKVVANIVG